MTLVVKCKGCGSISAARIQINQLDYGETTDIFEDGAKTCPHCGNTYSQITRDYWSQR